MHAAVFVGLLEPPFAAGLTHQQRLVCILVLACFILALGQLALR